MRKTLIALVLCAVLVSTVSLTSVVSARQVGSNTVNQNGPSGGYLVRVAFLIAGIYKFWQSKLNPTQIAIGTPVAMLVAGVLTLVTHHSK